jgi:hypothetical protein
VEPRRQAAQRVVGHRADGPQRMIGRHALLLRQVTKQVAALLVVSAHALAPLKERRGDRGTAESTYRSGHNPFFSTLLDTLDGAKDASNIAVEKKGRSEARAPSV